ncbi:VirK/YbjX family protein [Vibrio chagasii]|nr:VirK/YbjX family protein [Vibrio chagasii]
MYDELWEEHNGTQHNKCFYVLPFTRNKKRILSKSKNNIIPPTLRGWTNMKGGSQSRY